MSDAIGGSNAQLARRRVLFGLAASFGLSATANLFGTASAKPPARGWPLWAVEGKGVKAHLFGETPPRRGDWRDPRIERLLSESSVLWVETNEKRRADIGDLVSRYGMDAGKPLDAWLTVDDKARLAKALKVCGVPADSIAPLRPWLAGASLQQAYYKAAGASGNSADKLLATRADKSGIAVSSEFPAQDDVFAWFGAMSPVQDVQFLRYALDEILAGPKNGEQTYADWSAGRFGRAAKVMEDMARTSPELFRMIAIERNRHWLPRFHAMQGSEKPALVVVGLYHLVGPENLRAQLERDGYRPSHLMPGRGPPGFP